jgi:hypothetical protein
VKIVSNWSLSLKPRRFRRPYWRAKVNLDELGSG